MAKSTGDKLLKVLEDARDLAIQNNDKYVTLDHIFFIILADHHIRELLRIHGCDYIRVVEQLEQYLITANVEKERDPLVDRIRTSSVQKLFKQAQAQAIIDKRTTFEVIDLVIALLDFKNSVSYQILINSGLDENRFKTTLMQIVAAKVAEENKRQTVTSNGSSDVAAKVKPGSALAQFCINLNELAAQGKFDPVIGREDEIEKILQVLGRKIKRNALLVGDAGTGKSAIVNGLVLDIANRKVPESLQNCVVYELDTGALIAGTRFRGEFEERIKAVLDELIQLPNSILFIDEIHMTKGGGGADNPMDFANLLKPALAKGDLRVIGATTIEEYKKYFEKDKALVRRFYKINVEEPSIEDTKLILRGVVNSFEKFHNIKYTQEALDAAVDLSVKHIHNKRLPDKAFDIIDSVGSKFKLFNRNKENVTIDVSDIEQEVSKIAKISVNSVKTDNNSKIRSLNKDLKSKIFGQDEVIDQVVNSIYVAKAGLRKSEKTMLSALFQGPTGVGKTEICKQIAELLGIEFVRFDMSEYQEKHSVAKLIGAPPGYVGFDDGTDGALLNAIEKNPHCVLLLDEVEKAHPDVLNILLQIMDYGILTSNSEKKVSFRNVILVMTSNLGASDSENVKTFGFARSEEQDTKSTEIIDKAVKDYFKPEFRNRLDLIVKFKSLNKETMIFIVDKFISEMNELSTQQNISIQITTEAKENIIEKAFEEKLGARPIEGIISSEIKIPLSMKIINGELPNGGTVCVSVDDNNKLELDIVKFDDDDHDSNLNVSEEV